MIVCVRWCLHFQLSCRDGAEIAGELGVVVSPSTLLRWVVGYAAEFERGGQKWERRLGRSGRAEETFSQVRGPWMSRSRAGDGPGRTVESCGSRTRARAAAKALFRKARKRHGEPRTITLDGFKPSHAAWRRRGRNTEFHVRGENPVKIRSCQ
jgi:transposase-like protein